MLYGIQVYIWTTFFIQTFSNIFNRLDFFNCLLSNIFNRLTDDESNNEESDSQEHSNTRDDVDEMRNLLGDGGVSGLNAGGQAGDATHTGVISDIDHQPAGSTWGLKYNVKNSAR